MQTIREINRYTELGSRKGYNLSVKTKQGFACIGNTHKPVLK
jgi:hypothetical protein